MEVSFTNAKFDIWTYSRYGCYCIVVKDARQARLLNAVLKYYPKDTKFAADDEVRFKFYSTQIESIASTSPIIGKILAQIFRPTPTLGPC